MWHKLRSHAYTRIADYAPDSCPSLFWVRQLIAYERDGASFRGVFDAVRQEIEIYLRDLEFVAVHDLRLNVVGKTEMDVLSFHSFSDDDAESLIHISATARLLVELEFSTLDARHLQHVVDKREQEVTGSLNLHQVVLVLEHAMGAVVIDIFFEQFRISENHVHWRADIVAHIEEESRFRLAGFLCAVVFSTAMHEQEEENKQDKARQ